MEKANGYWEWQVSKPRTLFFLSLIKTKVLQFGHWVFKAAEKTFDELNKIWELRSQNRIELHVKEVRKRGNQIKTEDNECKLSNTDTQKNEKFEKVKNAKYSDLVDLV